MELSKTKSIKENENKFEVELEYSSCVNFSFQQNNISYLHRLVLTNKSDFDYSNLTCKISFFPNFANEIEFNIEKIEANSYFPIDLNSKCDIVLNGEYLSALNERYTGEITVHISSDDENKLDKKRKYNIDVFPKNEWTGLVGLPEQICSYIFPNVPEVTSIVGHASKILQNTTNDPSIDGYLSNSKERVFMIVSAIFDAIASLKIPYWITDTSFEKSGQKIRFPKVIVKDKQANCLDMSLLFCGAIERAGLKPILVFIDGHAFAGCWLIKSESFNKATIDNILTLKKAVDSDKIFLFETTLCNDSGRKVNLINAKDSIDLDGIEKRNAFIYLVDVKAARDKGIKPLPEVIPDGGLITNDDATTSEDSPISNVGVEFEEDIVLAEVEAKEVSLIDTWKSKLLNFNKNNKLLNFKDGNNSINIQCNNLSSFALSLGESSFEILPSISNDPREISSKDNAAFINKQIDAGKLMANLNDKVLRKKLNSLYTSVRGDLDETGSNTLYLALGMLTWTDVDNKKKKFNAPIILISVSLERKSRLSGFVLQKLDAEVTINETLLTFLKNEFNLDLEGINSLVNENSGGLDVSKVIQFLKQEIYDIDGWSISNEVWLSQFSFEKYLQWKDLNENSEEIIKNKVVKSLLDKSNPNEGNVVVTSENELDSIVNHNQLYCPLSYDSSQLNSIMAAHRGVSFIMSGPPGTGKSTTISNIIVDSLAKSKRVLFVSEKRVALEVVYNQLLSLGVGEFCLELHSNKTGKKDVLNQFTLPDVKDIDSQQWDDVSGNLEDYRNELNLYIKALHKIYPNGLSAYQAFGYLIKNKYFADSQALMLKGIDTLNHSKEQLDKQRVLCKSLSIALNTITKEQLESLSFLKYSAWKPMWQDNILATVNDLKNAVDELQVAYSKLLESFGISLDMNVCSAMFLKYKSFLNYFKQSPALLLSSFVANEDFEAFKSLVDEFICIANNKELVAKKLSNFDINSLLAINFEKLRNNIDFSNINLGSYLKNKFHLYKLRRAIKNKKIKFNISEFDELESDVASFSKNQAALNSLIEKNDILKEVYAKYNFNTTILAEHLEYACQLHQHYSLLGLDEATLTVLQKKCDDILNNEHKQLQNGGTYSNQIDELNALYNKYLDIYDELGKLSDPIYEKSEIDFDVFENTAMMHNVLNSNKDSLTDWCDFNRLCDNAKSISLQSLVDSIFEGNINADELVELVEAKYQKLFIYDLLEQESTLSRFRSNQFENTINEFSSLDDEYRQLTKNVVIDKLNSNLPDINDSVYSDEFAILNRELVKQKGHISIRKLLSSIPSLVKTMKPCFMMSPLSVAKYLDLNAEKFDLVIFDEASQIPVCDAVGVMGRANQILVVGDSQQLPPTSFFVRGTCEDDFDAQVDVIQDLDSILDATKAIHSMPKYNLKWHYRSRSESLIAFSNSHYYDNSLYTFPSVSASDSAVSLIKCNGVYDRGHTCVNKQEAKAVVAEIIRRVEDPLLKEKSIGVITFNQAQKMIIDEFLENERAKHPALDSHLNINSPNCILVKNIENVQGDQRDVILFSITFGPDANGNISMNYGPLNKNGGERRLNVAISRAREEMVVFSSLPSEKINLSNTRSKGVAHLKEYLEFAERGMNALRSCITASTSDDKDLLFETEVVNFLKSKGFNVHTKVGCSGYRIDIAVLDNKGKYVVGIECDGATYRNAATARDRDKLRKSILEDFLGWKMIRIWSDDWWKNKEKSEAKLYDLIQEIIKSL